MNRDIKEFDRMNSFLKCENVTKHYFLKKALNGVSFEAERGIIIGLIGPNGAGKTTLLKTIFGLCRPTKGRVIFEGKYPDRSTKARIAFLPEIDHLYDWMTVHQTINFISPFYPDWEKGRMAKLFDILNLDERMEVGKLSKGQRARLKILLTLSRRSSLVLLDEPFSGIDPVSRGKILQAINSEFRAEEQTIILSTHEVLETESIFDRVIILEQGNIKLMGNIDDIRQKSGKSIRVLLEEVYG
jgi:ABC-2 type transport system ATP-binding protein